MAASIRKNASGETEYSAPRKEAQKASGNLECSRVEIEIAKNGGFSVRKYYRDKPSPKGNMSSQYREPDHFAFSTDSELFAFLKKTFTGYDAGDD